MAAFTLSWRGLAVLAFSLQTAIAEPVVTLPDTKVTYKGTAIESVEHFQNIKFAHDTSGSRRFAPPEPYVPGPGTEVDATSPGAACPQTKDAMLPFFFETQNMSEDCLNLRIARPEGTSVDSKLPVVVWVHGGGVVKGSAYDGHFDPDNMIKFSKAIGSPVIYVALNYRLTIFGFARLPALKEQKSLNAGMRDQRAGFEWVKNNIAAFGGDPERITAYGLSAGGTFSTMHLMAYGGERGVPFTQVWTMSGPPGTALNMSSDVSEYHTTAVAKNVGCDEQNSAGLLQCLRDISMDMLLDAGIKYSVANHPPAGLFTFIPSVDDDMYHDRPSALYKAGKFVKGIPMVFGWTEDDGAMNSGPVHLIQSEDDMKPAIRNFAATLTDEDLSQIFSLYQSQDFEARLHAYEATKRDTDPTVSIHWFRLSQIVRDILFTCSSIDFGSEMSQQSSASNLDRTSVWLYALNQSMLTPLWQGAGMPYIGVAHGSDSNYLFNLFPEGKIKKQDKDLAEELTSAFIRFATTGNPNGARGRSMQTWPEALPQDDLQKRQAGSANVHVQIIGGPLRSTTRKEVDDQDDKDTAHLADEKQQILGYEMGAMKSAGSRNTVDLVTQEKLAERCAFLTSLSEKLGS